MNKIFSEKFVAPISILWIVVMACLVVLKRQTLSGLELNSIGDFLAGAFAPLGFFWLVAGFYQQGKGLAQNSKALEIQVMELSNSTNALNAQVLEQKKLLDATNSQIEINLKKNNFDVFSQKKQFQPFFHISHSSIDHQTYVGGYPLKRFTLYFNLKNSREKCRNLTFSYNYEDENSPDFLFKESGFDLLDSRPLDVSLEVTNLPSKKNEDEYYKLILRLTYTDALDTLQYQCINIFLKKSTTGYFSFSHFVMSNQTLH